MLPKEFTIVVCTLFAQYCCRVVHCVAVHVLIVKIYKEYQNKLLFTTFTPLIQYSSGKAMGTATLGLGDN